VVDLGRISSMYENMSIIKLDLANVSSYSQISTLPKYVRALKSMRLLNIALETKFVSADSWG
jgi:hypothetical protein